jgi:putative autotransporter adhesin-like protein
MKIWILVCIAVIGATGCSLIDANKVKGSGVVKSEKRSLAPYTALEVSCPASLELRLQESESSEISGDDNLIPLITTEVKNNTLYIRSTQEIAPREKLRITLSNPDLKRFAFSGAGDANVSNIKNDRIEIVLSGAGDLTASGETKEAAITLSGAGRVDAKNLLAASAKANSTGVGSLDVYATEQLEAKASGVGEINYYGNPKVVKKDASGIGSINER